MRIPGSRSAAPRRGAGARSPGILAAALSLAGASLAGFHLGGCGRDFNHPFDPRSDVYAGSAWSRDGDGDGVADSVEKYAPGCAAGPADCLRKAQANAGLLPSRLDSVAAEDLSLLAGGPAAAPRWRWYPAGLSGITCSLVPDDPAVAAAADSLVQPLSPGTTGFTLTARTASGQTRTARFTVTVSRARVPVLGIKALDLLLAPGESRLPEVTIEPPGATDPRYEIITHDPRVAFGRQGMVVGAAAGRTLITVRALDGGHEAMFLAVVHRKVAGISARPLAMRTDSPPQAPLLEFFPADATDQGYSLSGGDPAVAVATGDGRIRPMGPGITWLTASVEGGLTADFSVSVEAVIVPVRAVKVPDMTITLLTEADDRVREPDIAWTPADATDKGYSLASDNPAVVRVVGGSVEAVRKGEAKITITSDDGNKRDTFKVKVNVLIPCGSLLNPCPDGGGD